MEETVVFEDFLVHWINFVALCTVKAIEWWIHTRDKEDLNFKQRSGSQFHHMKNKPFYIRIYVNEQLMNCIPPFMSAISYIIYLNSQHLYQVIIKKVVGTSNELENRDSWFDKLLVANNLVLVNVQEKNMGSYLNVEFWASIISRS